MRHKRAILIPATLAITLVTGAGLAACSTGSSAGHSTPTATQSASTATLPSDFPKSDVPLIDGKILVADGDAASGWSVTVTPASKDGFDAAKAKLTKAGFTATSSKPGSMYLSGSTYDVLLTSPGDTVTYAVTPAAS